MTIVVRNKHAWILDGWMCPLKRESHASERVTLDSIIIKR